MTEEKVLIKADIRFTPSRHFRDRCVAILLCCTFFIFGSFFLIFAVTDDVDLFYSGISSYVMCDLFFGVLICWGMYNNYKNFPKNNSLSLTNKGIKGRLAKLSRPYITKEIQLPISEVSSIAISESSADKIRSGQTVVISSASGTVKFPMVHNAKAFVTATLTEIEKFKQSVKFDNKNLVAAIANNSNNNASNPSLAEKIKELKDLLDSGLISQEEFETKRKELLDKM